jgi:hypothetical protein
VPSLALDAPPEIVQAARALLRRLHLTPGDNPLHQLLLYLPHLDSELDRNAEKDALQRDRYAAVARAGDTLTQLGAVPTVDAIKVYLNAALLFLRDYRRVPGARDLVGAFPEATLRAVMREFPVAAPLAMSVLSLGRPAAAGAGTWPYLGSIAGVTLASRNVATMAVMLACAVAQPRRRGGGGEETLPALFTAVLKELGAADVPLALGGKGLRRALGQFPAAARVLEDEGVEPPASWQRELFIPEANVLEPALLAELEFLLDKRLRAMQKEDTDNAHVLFVLKRYPGWTAANLFMDAHLDDWLLLLQWVLGAPANARSHADIEAFYLKFPLETGDKDTVASNKTDAGGGGGGGDTPERTAPPPAGGAAKGAPCGFCQKPGHAEAACRRKQGLCLKCGGTGHQIKDCKLAKTRVVEVAEAAIAAGAPAPDPAAFMQLLSEWMAKNTMESRHAQVEVANQWRSEAGSDLGSDYGPPHLASPHAYSSRATTIATLDLLNKKEGEERGDDVRLKDPDKHVPWVPSEHYTINIGQPAVGFVNGRHGEQAAPCFFYADSGGPTGCEAGAFVNEDWVPDLPRIKFDTPISVKGAGIDAQATHYVDLELDVLASRACVTTQEGLDPPTRYAFKVRAIVVPAERWKSSAFHTVGGVNVSIVLNPGALRHDEPALIELWKQLHEAQAGKPLVTHAPTSADVTQGKGRTAMVTCYLDDFVIGLRGTATADDEEGNYTEQLLGK